MDKEYTKKCRNAKAHLQTRHSQPSAISNSLPAARFLKLKNVRK